MRSAWRTISAGSDGQLKSWSKGVSRKTARRDGWDGVDQLTGRTACDRIAVFAGSQRLIGQFVRVVVEDASAVTLFGRVETSERIATPA